MLTDQRSINLDAVLATFDERWSPRIAMQVNDYDVRVAKIEGEYIWHSHEDTDEFFLVLHGAMTIMVRDRDGEHAVVLNVGDAYVVPRGTHHKPTAPNGASILMFERSGTLTTGNYEGEIPDHIDSTSGHKI